MYWIILNIYINHHIVNQCIESNYHSIIVLNWWMIQFIYKRTYDQGMNRYKLIGPRTNRRWLNRWATYESMLAESMWLDAWKWRGHYGWRDLSVITQSIVSQDAKCLVWTMTQVLQKSGTNWWDCDTVIYKRTLAQ